MSKKVIATISRICLVCGKPLRINIFEDHTYEGGHYFGVMEIPKEIVEGNPREHPNYAGEENGYVKIEYWECSRCYNK